MFFLFNDTATTEIYTLSLHDALPISSSLPTPETSTALIEIAEAYASGWDTATLTRRRPILRPFLPLIAKILKRIFKPQYIFNSLVLEVLRKQEERIKALESRKTDGLSVSGDE